MSNTSILVIAFNRPNTLKELLAHLEVLSKRKIMISIDGSKGDSDFKQSLTLELALLWKSSSQHEVEIVTQDTNLGIYNHLPFALNKFFAKETFGLILEDDMEFNSGLIRFVDQNKDLIESNSFWSICGHNPSNTSDPSSLKPSKISFRPSRFHAVWGWACSRDIGLAFAEEYPNSVDLNEAFEVLKRTSKGFTNDPFLQKAFVLTWMRKISGWNARREQSGWDTRWAYEGWKSGKFSLLPDASLSRESLNQLEGQTHKHMNFGSTWSNKLNSTFTFSIETMDSKSEIKNLKTWGITRRYSWFYQNRIRRQLAEFIE